MSITIWKSKLHRPGCGCDMCRAKRARRKTKMVMWARELARRRKVADTNGVRT